jgi:hypothetical protein
MDNFHNKKLEKIPAKAPEGMYAQVQQRIIYERTRIVKTRRQLIIGSALLLVIGAFNIGIIFLKNWEKQPISKANTEHLLYETYFDNGITLSNEK